MKNIALNKTLPNKTSETTFQKSMLSSSPTVFGKYRYIITSHLRVLYFIAFAIIFGTCYFVLIS